MDRFEFRTSSVTGDQWRRIKRRLNPGTGPPSLSGRLPGGGAGIAGIPLPLIIPVLCGALVIAAGIGAPNAVVNGVTITGSHILVVEDVSGSMASSQEELARQKARFGSALFEGGPKMDGFGVMSTGENSNLLHVLQRELPARRGVDTVYVFSDFQPGTASWDCNDLAGLAQLRQLIRSAGVRLYLSTVNMLPSRGLLSIARESDGGLVGLAGAADSLQARRDMCSLDE